ncbi:ferredoxin [Actibacterium sp. D379-3]
MRRYDTLRTRVRAAHLDIFGAFHPGPDDGAPKGCGTLVLLGPLEPGFWPHVRAAPEFHDGAGDPLDRWSARVIGALAADLNAVAVFPFGGPPFQPFIRWAQCSGRAWASPVSLLVHDVAGLFASYRGALALNDVLDLPALPPCPCDTCVDRPCAHACPVGALGAGGYDLAACHGFLDSAPGQDCLQNGCAVRRACPVSETYGRMPAQSAFHMAAFHR